MPRTRPDACPGALATHTADDGELARVRLPGGVLSAGQLRVLALAAVELGDGELHLTSRGNVQLRAVRDPGDLAVRLAGAGLLPSQTHERVRNILASPLPGVLDVVPLAGELDRAVCADGALAALPGRFLWALDSGVGDVAGEDADACWRAVDRADGVLAVGGSDAGVLVPAGRAVAALTAVARAFLRLRGPAWRMRELPAEQVDRVLAAAGPRGRHGRWDLATPPATAGRHGDAVLA
ncbi:MAG: precorrin-3B synthase, partial [Thermocrispum sp.]